jgi:hypothetical protein
VNNPIEPRNDEAGGFGSLSELLSHLDEHGGNAAVVVTLKPPPGQIVPSPNETGRLSRELIERAEQATGLRVGKSNVFQRLGRFVLDAPAGVIRHIAQQPEVTETTPNELRGFGLIDPVRKGPAEGWK